MIQNDNEHTSLNDVYNVIKGIFFTGSDAEMEKIDRTYDNMQSVNMDAWLAGKDNTSEKETSSDK